MSSEFEYHAVSNLKSTTINNTQRSRMETQNSLLKNGFIEEFI